VRIESSMTMKFMVIVLLLTGRFAKSEEAEKVMGKIHISLPKPALAGPLSLEESIERRRSIRDFADDSLNLEQISQLLWAAQGITGSGGLRAVPSAGALYPLEIYLLVGRVRNIDPGLYRFVPSGQRLLLLSKRPVFDELVDSVVFQNWVDDAAVALIITAVYERVTRKYGERGVRYAHLEAGCAVQNIYLQTVSLGLGTTVIGAFDDYRISKLLGLPKGENPLAILPIGRPATK